MKKLITLVLAIQLIACTKNKPQQPAPAPIQVQAQQNNLNAFETPMCADWKLCNSWFYTGGNLISTSTYTNAVDCHLLLSATDQTSTAYPTGKDCETGIYTCNPLRTLWFVKEADILSIGSQEYRIQMVGNDSLVLTLGRAVSAYSQKYKFYK